MLSEAKLETARARELLAEICGQLGARASAHADLGIDIDFSDTHGSVDFGWGRCAFEAEPGALTVRVEAERADDVERLQELLTRHLERHNSGEQPAIVWDTGGAPGQSSREPRRKDLMRSFHRRARGTSPGS